MRKGLFAKIERDRFWNVTREIQESDVMDTGHGGRVVMYYEPETCPWVEVQVDDEEWQWQRLPLALIYMNDN